MAKNKAYVVFQGTKPGIYTDWGSCSASVQGYKGAIYKGYATLEEANKAWDDYTASGAMPYSSVAASKASASTAKESGASKSTTFQSYMEQVSSFYERFLDAYEVHTDGGANPNPGPGGFGYVVVGPDKEILEEGFGSVLEHLDEELATTNNRMELMAAIYGLQAVPEGGRALFMTDSTLTYAGICMNLDKDPMPRFIKWEKNGWKKSDGKTPENIDLVKALYDQAKLHRVVGIPKAVKPNSKSYEQIGHEGRGKKKLSSGLWEFPYNKICDKLAEMGEEYAQEMTAAGCEVCVLIHEGKVLDDRAYLVKNRNECGHGLVVDIDGNEQEVN